MRGKKITSFEKRNIILASMRGEESASIARALGVNVCMLSRLKHDEEYQAIQKELEEEASQTFRLRLKASIGSILDGLLAISTMEVSNEIVTEVFLREEGNKRTKVTRRSYAVDARLAAVRLQSLSTLLEAYLRTTERESSLSHGEDLFQRREQLLAAYGLAPPALPLLTADEQPHATAQELSDALPLGQERTLAEMLKTLLPDRRKN